MRVAVEKAIPAEMARTWGCEPNDRAVVKMEIAEAMGRVARVRDMISWHERMMPDGTMLITGVIDISGPAAEQLPDYVLNLDEQK